MKLEDDPLNYIKVVYKSSFLHSLQRQPLTLHLDDIMGWSLLQLDAFQGELFISLTLIGLNEIMEASCMKC